jgi:hypothetical protein
MGFYARSIKQSLQRGKILVAMRLDAPSKPGLVIPTRQLASPKRNTRLTGGSNVVKGKTIHTNILSTCRRAVGGCKTDACGG